MRVLTSRERRVASLGLLALLLWLVWYVLIESAFLAPLDEITAAQEQVQLRERHYNEIIARGAGLASALAVSRDDPTLRAGLLAGDDPNAVAADLMQQVLNRVASHADKGPGCEVTQRMPMASSDQVSAEPYRPVKVSLTLECAIAPLADVLHDLEYGQPSLFIDQMSIRRAGDAPPVGGPGRMKVNLLVRGYMRSTGSGGGGT